MRNLLTVLIILFLSGCKVTLEKDKKEETQSSSTVAPQSLSVEGYVSYSANDLYANKDYELYNFKVYALGNKAYYSSSVSYNGYYVFYDIEPDTYDFILIYEDYLGKLYKVDNKGKYTYYSSVKVQVTDKNILAPKLTPKRAYLTERETQDIVDDVDYARGKL